MDDGVGSAADADDGASDGLGSAVDVAVIGWRVVTRGSVQRWEVAKYTTTLRTTRPKRTAR